jgi:uncharacterized integral membrane protein
MNESVGTSPVRTAKQVVIAVIVLLLLIVLFQNTAVVTFSFLFWEFSISQILLIPLMLLVGFVVGMLTYSLIARKKRRDKASSDREPV